MKSLRAVVLASALAFGFGAQAATTIVPNSALVASTTYYTDLIGGGIGPIVITTGGGNGANVGNSTGRNDDGFSGPISLGFTISFFGTAYTSLYINNNGNISFGNGISAYIPAGPTGAASPVISPFFTDVDTRNTTSGVVHVRTDIADQIIVTWDAVGAYSTRGAPFDSFQLILRGTTFAIPVGEGSIGFWYKDMGFAATETNSVAAVGFGDGAGNAQILEGSLLAGLNNIVANHHIWFDQNLVVVPPVNPPVAGVPEPQSLALLALGLVGLGLARRRKFA